jgi:hypothetical protein
MINQKIWKKGRDRSSDRKKPTWCKYKYGLCSLKEKVSEKRSCSDYEQGKNDAYNSFNLKLGRRTLSMIQADTRKQTLEEVLKEYRKRLMEVHDFKFEDWLEQKLREMV